MSEDNTFEDMKQIAGETAQVAEGCVQSMKRMLQVNEYYDRRSARRFKWFVTMYVIIIIVSLIVIINSIVAINISYQRKASIAMYNATIETHSEARNGDFS